MLRSLLIKTWPLTISAAMLGLAATILVVRLFGLTVFADYSIDLAKLSLLLLLTELVPSSFSIFYQQKDARFRANLASFFIAASLAVLLVTFALAQTLFFSAFSAWIYLYIVCIVFQRYFDSRLQAAGRVRGFFALPFVTNLVRLAAIIAIYLAYPGMAPNTVLWSAIALGGFASLVVMLFRYPAGITPFIHNDHLLALKEIWQLRNRYYSYYPNIALKRLRDVAMPLVSDHLVADRAEIGRYLLVFRGVEFAGGQLRVIEALLANFQLREKLAEKRFRSMLILSVAGQAVAFSASVLLLSQTGLDAALFVAAAVASLFIYPYVAELVVRSDSYASFAPHRVTISLLAFLAGIAITITVAIQFTELTAPVLVLAPLTGQILASASYFLSGKKLRKREE